MNNEVLTTLVGINESEKQQFKELIRDMRKTHIRSPSEHVQRVFAEHQEIIENVKNSHNISETISELRHKTYEIFLQEEAEFNTLILKSISEQLATPKSILDYLIDSQLDLSQDATIVITQVKNLCGEYAGRISPFVYELSLSNTQSRRSRAGKTFEAIIYKLYEVFKYEFSSQKSIGRKAFQEQNLGKIVDSLLPNIEAFQQRRDKVIIGTMKTTLRERWQEVIEELNRTNLPSIYLLTVDEDISVSKATQMSHHNVIIVVPKSVKEQEKLQNMRNIISFEDYFLQEIPDKLQYWEKN